MLAPAPKMVTEDCRWPLFRARMSGFLCQHKKSVCRSVCKTCSVWRRWVRQRDGSGRVHMCVTDTHHSIQKYHQSSIQSNVRCFNQSNVCCHFQSKVRCFIQSNVRCFIQSNVCCQIHSNTFKATHFLLAFITTLVFALHNDNISGKR